MERYLSAYKVLSDQTRLRILRLLLTAKHELCICEIMDSLGIPQYNVSKQMKELRLAGLVRENKKGRFVFYSASDPGDPFQKNVIGTVSAIPGELFNEDVRRMKRRLSLREDGKCVVGMKEKASR